MKKLWTHREIDAPAEVLWRLLTDPQEWSDWGPSVRGVDLHAEKLERGVTGTVTTIVGLELGFEVTEYVDGVSWAWKVSGVPATHHTVEPLGANRCRVGFGVPWAVAPYLAVCGVALRRLDTMATTPQAATTEQVAG